MMQSLEQRVAFLEQELGKLIQYVHCNPAWMEAVMRLDMARTATIGKIKPELWRDIFERPLTPTPDGTGKE